MIRPVVVKLGSALVVDGRGRVRRELVRARAAEIAELVRAGTPVCVVSSGAIALGLSSLGLTARPRSLPRLQAASALAAAVVAADEVVAQRFLDRYRGTAAFWQAPTRFTDGFALTGAPETGINVDWVPGPRGPVTYRDLWLRQYRVVGDGTQRR